jgi:hypothetical protein
MDTLAKLAKFYPCNGTTPVTVVEPAAETDEDLEANISPAAAEDAELALEPLIGSSHSCMVQSFGGGFSQKITYIGTSKCQSDDMEDTHNDRRKNLQRYRRNSFIRLFHNKLSNVHFERKHLLCCKYSGTDLKPSISIGEAVLRSRYTISAS